LSGEMGDDRIVEEVEGRAALLGAGGQHGPNPLAPTASRFTTRALRDPAVDHHESEPLLHRVVGRLHAGRPEESEVVLAVLAESLADVLRLASRRRPPRHLEDRSLGLIGRTTPSLRRRLVAAMPNAKQTLDRAQQLLAQGNRAILGNLV